MIAEKIEIASFSCLPDAMRAAPRWLVWKAKPHADPSKKPKKIPYYTTGTPREGALDTPADRAKLASFEAASAALRTGRYTGIGFALGDDGNGNYWQGVDLDGTDMRPELAALVERLPGYVERSPSGHGWHAVGIGRDIAPLGSNASGIEAYSHGRYFTVTGDAGRGDVECIADFIETTLTPLHGGVPARASKATARVDASSFFAKVNAKALASLASWVPAIFPKARAYHDGYRVSSVDLGRDLEEDLSIIPAGARDFGEEAGKTPIDLVIEWGPATDATSAALLLCDLIGISPTALGWCAKAEPVPEPRVTLSPPAAPAPVLAAGVLESASPAEGKAPQTNPERLSYSATKSGTFWVKRQEDGNDEHVFLANFTAEIVAETTIDDGAERKRRMEIAGSINGRPLPPATVASGEFAALGWVGEQWGSAAHIAPGHGKKDRLRYAIQVLSESTQHRMVYQHTGWREIGGQWVYLTPTAVIGAAGAVGGIDVDLPGTLADYALMPAPADTAAAAARASLGVLSCAPAPIAVPLFLAPYRAMLGEALPGDFSLFLAGVTGSRKTELAAICQAHFGDAWHGKRLPAAWSSTPNSLERAAFLAKDAVMVVDDFCPTGTTTDIARFHTGADRLLRAQGNRAGRQRMNADGTLRPAYHPRGLIVATGEDIPRGQSLRGRLLILEFDSATVDLGALSTMQAHASTGRLSAAAGAFAQWLAPRMGELKKSLPVMRNHLRSEITATAHSRHPDTLAGLVLTAQLFAQFATDHGVVLPADWQADIQNALLQAGADQQQAVASEEPAGRFVRLVHSGLSAGLCHVRRKDGREPYAAEDMTAAGWQLRHLGSGEHAHDEWLPQGPCIGWFDDNGLYLDPDAGYRSAARFASDQGQALPLTPRALFKALDNRGHIVTKNPGRTTVKHRFGDGTTKSVLHLIPIPMRNYGNNGNNGNNSTKADDFHEKNVFPFAGTGKELSGTTGTGTGTGTGTYPVGTDDCSRNVPAVPAMFPQAFSEREQKNACNTLTSKENLQPVPVVPVVPANENIPTNNFAGVALSPVAATVQKILSAAPGGMLRDDLAKAVSRSHPTAGAMVDATINHLLLSGRIAPTNGRIALGAGHSGEARQ